MLVFCFFWFLFLYGITFFWSKEKDIFSPLKFVTAKYALLNLCFILYICFYPEAFDRRILRVCNVTLNEAFFRYTILQTVAFVSLVSGMLFFAKKEIKVPDSNLAYNYRSLKIMAFVCLITAFAAYGIFLHRIGGLSILLTNLDKRVELQGGQYILNLMPLLVMSCLLFLLCIKISNKITDKVLFVVFSIVTLCIFNSFGSRETSLLFVITIFVGSNYLIRKYKFSGKNILGVLCLGLTFFIYMVSVPIIRAGDSADITKVVSMKKFVYNVSYAYIDVFAANYFNTDNAWYMDGYFAPVTTILAKDKGSIPQVDQGVYFNSIVVNNKDYKPPLPRKDVSKVSWPTENFGFAYANFLLPGLIFFYFLQGVVFRLAYRVLKVNIHNPMPVMLYVLVIFTFNFSSLRIAGFIKVVPLIYIGYVAFNKFIRLKSLTESLKIY